jgi:hypothetical protein
MKPDNVLRALQHFGSQKSSERKPQQESDLTKQRGQDQVAQVKKMEALRTLRLARDAELANVPAPSKPRKSKVRSGSSSPRPSAENPGALTD